MSLDNVSFRILRNSAFNILRGTIALPIALILTPVVLAAIGIEKFGVWSLVFVFVQSATLFDLGLSGSLVKFAAEYHEKREYHRLNRTLGSAFVVYGAVGLVVGGTLWFGRDYIVTGLFKATRGDPHLEVVIAIAAAAFLIQLLSSALGSLLQGLQRMDLSNLALVLTQLVNFGLSLWVVWQGFGLVALVAAQGVAVWAGLTASALAVRKIYPDFRRHPIAPNRETILSLIPLSLSMQCLSLQTLLFYQFDKLVLSSLYGPSFSGYYEVAAKPLTSLRGVPLTVVQPVLPAVSALQAQNDQGRVHRLFWKVSKYVLVGAAPVFVLVLILAEPLLDFWFGGRLTAGSEVITLNLRLVAAAYFINLVGASMTYVAVGLGDKRSLLRYSLLGSVLHIVLTLLGVHVLGYSGAPLGLLLATTISVGYFYFSFSARNSLKRPGLFHLGLIPVGVAVLLSVLLLALIRGIFDIRSPTLGIALVGLYFLAYTSVILVTGYISKEERVQAAQFLRRFGLEVWESISSAARGWKWPRATFRFLARPEEVIKAAAVRRFGKIEQSDRLDLRWALLWGWGLDRVRRNVAVAQSVREILNGNRLQVLDVGASDCGVHAYLPVKGYDVFSLDLEWTRISANGRKSRSVNGDGCLLPFPDGAFDVVVSVDCLEHVPPACRNAYLNELRRVAKLRVVLHFPAIGSGQFQGGRFDALFKRCYRLMLRQDKNIEEHLQNGLPDVGEVEALFPGCSVTGRENGYLWNRYMLLERVPYLSFLTGLIFLPARKRLDAPPYHAAMIVYDVPIKEEKSDFVEPKEVTCPTE